MLKYRVIRSFALVWLAVCLSYVGIRTAWGVVFGEAGVPHEEVESDTTPPAEAPTELLTEPEAVPEVSAEPASEPDAMPEAQTEQTTTPESEPSLAEDSLPMEETLSEVDGEMTDGEELDQVTEEANIPSLEEYLSWYTCGSCRRNCSLANPRCHNGSRLAEVKAQEYLDIYGT